MSKGDSSCCPLGEGAVLSGGGGALHSTGFPQRLENMENESSHGKVLEHETVAKGHAIL